MRSESLFRIIHPARIIPLAMLAYVICAVFNVVVVVVDAIVTDITTIVIDVYSIGK